MTNPRTPERSRARRVARSEVKVDLVELTEAEFYALIHEARGAIATGMQELETEMAAIDELEAKYLTARQHSDSQRVRIVHDRISGRLGVLTEPKGPIGFSASTNGHKR